MTRRSAPRKGSLAAAVALTVILTHPLIAGAAGSLSVSPNAGDPGGPLQVLGAGFQPAETVTLLWDPGALTQQALGHAQASAAGDFTLTTTVPANAAGGAHLIGATGGVTGQAQSTGFSVTQATPTAVPGKPTVAPAATAVPAAGQILATTTTTNANTPQILAIGGMAIGFTILVLATQADRKRRAAAAATSGAGKGSPPESTSTVPATPTVRPSASAPTGAASIPAVPAVRSEECAEFRERHDRTQAALQKAEAEWVTKRDAESRAEVERCLEADNVVQCLVIACEATATPGSKAVDPCDKYRRMKGWLERALHEWRIKQNLAQTGLVAATPTSASTNPAGVERLRTQLSEAKAEIATLEVALTSIGARLTDCEAKSG